MTSGGSACRVEKREKRDRHRNVLYLFSRETTISCGAGPLFRQSLPSGTDLYARMLRRELFLLALLAHFLQTFPQSPSLLLG